LRVSKLTVGQSELTTIRPILKGLHSPDAHDLETFAPADSGNWCILVQAMFGPELSDGEESFGILVCTPQWLAQKVAEDGIAEGRHHLVVTEFDLPRLRSFLQKYADKCSGKTWRDAALKLSRLGYWEFEDYVPYVPKAKS
jgi:Immunity protein 8